MLVVREAFEPPPRQQQLSTNWSLRLLSAPNFPSFSHQTSRTLIGLSAHISNNDRCLIMETVPAPVTASPTSSESRKILASLIAKLKLPDCRYHTEYSEFLESDSQLEEQLYRFVRADILTLVDTQNLAPLRCKSVVSECHLKTLGFMAYGTALLSIYYL
ncbi:hypothetical protein AOQ84DRAFT_178666 [Glonium stellatum]|uniref:Uncharacterized protein n=1 Tax=Glonium stellatum TaxID=574774 RepID=A0A8E2F719_9PEZI|nr:hypothetical protein AOQ84DRAFT_178666 [Glonium stellatum]